MGERYLLDTNIVIYYLDNSLPKEALIFLDSALNVECNISVISRIELLSWGSTNLKENIKVEQFVNEATIYSLSEPIIRQTIDLRKKYKVKLPDAIIAATAIVHDFILISRNADDFLKITSCKFLNPFTNL